MTATAVIVAAGKGERFGDTGKVMAPLLGRPVLAWSLDAFERASLVAEIVIVVGVHTRDAVTDLIDSGRWKKVRAIVLGGATRQESTANGVAAVDASAEIILVHDGARPLIHPEHIDACVATAREHGGAILAAPLTDTIKRVENHRIAETIDRSTLWGAQTPQAFAADTMRTMVQFMLTSGAPVTDEASVAEALGLPVQIVVGDATNIKITHPTDIMVAEALLRARKDQNS